MENGSGMQIDDATEDNKIVLNLESPDWKMLVKSMLDEYKSLVNKNR
jgi:hypothetical protein